MNTAPTTKTKTDDAPAEVRVPCTAAQADKLRALLADAQSTQARLADSINTLVAGHVTQDFQQFRIEQDALVVILS